jgi:hypothetical protein
VARALAAMLSASGSFRWMVPTRGILPKWQIAEEYGLESCSQSTSGSETRRQIMVQLKGNRVGRIGEVVRLAVKDEEWEPRPSK